MKRGKALITWILIALLSVLHISFYTIAKADSVDTVIFSDSENQIYQYLLDSGYSEAGACGILGNISVENPEFIPGLYGNNQNTYGLFQWSNTGDRLSLLFEWCELKNLDPESIEGQLEFAIYEMKGGDAFSSKINDFLMKTDSPEEAAMEFAVGFERCIGSTSIPENDAVYTGNIYLECEGKSYQSLSKRMTNARKYYDYYCPKEVLEGEIQKEIQREIIENSVKTINWSKRIWCISIGYVFGCILGVLVIIHGVIHKRKLQVIDELPNFRMFVGYIGVKHLALAVVIDIFKLLIALLVMKLINGAPLDFEQTLLVGFGVILGNAFPFWNKFTGGIGIVSTMMCICVCSPLFGTIICILGFLFGIIIKSFPFGTAFVFLLIVPYMFICHGFEAGLLITASIVLLLIRHKGFISKYIDKELLKRHYRRYDLFLMKIIKRIRR